MGAAAVTRRSRKRGKAGAEPPALKAEGGEARKGGRTCERQTRVVGSSLECHEGRAVRPRHLSRYPQTSVQGDGIEMTW